MKQTQEQTDARPLFVEIATLCPACNGCGVTHPIQEACIHCDGEPSGCWNCDGLGHVDAYPVCDRCDGSGVVVQVAAPNQFEPLTPQFVGDLKSSSATAPLSDDDSFGTHAIDEHELQKFACPECLNSDLMRDTCDCCDGRGWFELT